MPEARFRLTFRHLFRILIFILALRYVNSSELDILMELKRSFINGDNLTTWNLSSTPCNGFKSNWEGVLCADDIIWGLRVEGKELGGDINTKILMKLQSLLTVSFQNNSFEGGFPEFNRLRRLRSIFLTANKFSGEIPADAFDGMTRLKKIYLANNHFEGRMPESLTALPMLRDLMFENNRFEGEIPVFVKDNLTSINLANNRLRGPIPKRLRKFPASKFSGNNELCGSPLQSRCKGDETSTGATIVIASAVAAALVAIMLACIILRKFRPSSTDAPPVAAYDQDALAEIEVELGRGKPAPAAKVDVAMKLVFLRDDVIEKFDLADLLKASAEILGGGVFGASYKATLSRHKVVVAKRFKQMNNVTKDEYVKHMTRLGKLKHPNLVPLIAFYYRKEEKLFVLGFAENFSLAVHLHGNRTSGSIILNWATRLKIIKGVARGLLHLYNELPSITAPHGHLKSSNVLLDREFKPLLTDYGLIPIINQEHARDVMIAFKSPEYKQHRRITKKTDVWSLGVLILEILTGKFPTNSFNQAKNGETDLVSFVDSTMKEEITSDVFDKEMGGFDKGNEEEMVKLLKIGLSCCEPDVDKRWDIKEVVDMIEEVREKNDNENDNNLR